MLRILICKSPPQQNFETNCKFLNKLSIVKGMEINKNAKEKKTQRFYLL